MKRAFLFVNQFYPPDTAPTGRILHDVAAELARRGHRVDVLCSKKPYARGKHVEATAMLEGVSVHRVRALP